MKAKYWRVIILGSIFLCGVCGVIGMFTPKTPQDSNKINSSPEEVLAETTTNPSLNISTIESTQAPTPTQEVIVTEKPNPTVIITSTPRATATLKPVVTKTPTPTAASQFACNCNRTCEQITSCTEAQYQLNVCRCLQRDADKDGIACDGAPLKCQ